MFVQYYYNTNCEEICSSSDAGGGGCDNFSTWYDAYDNDQVTSNYAFILIGTFEKNMGQILRL